MIRTAPARFAGRVRVLSREGQADSSKEPGRKTNSLPSAIEL